MTEEIEINQDRCRMSKRDYGRTLVWPEVSVNHARTTPRSQLDAVEHLTQSLGTLLDLRTLVVTQFLVEDRRDACLADHYRQTDVDLRIDVVVTLYSRHHTRPVIR